LTNETKNEPETAVDRIPEPELMDDHEQARAYAEADFSEPNQLFVALFREAFPDVVPMGTVLDLGCGPADIPLRLASLLPGVQFHGVDGSGAMLAHARRAWKAAGFGHRAEFFEGTLPQIDLPREDYEAILSNSLLHHLHAPDVLWSAVKARGCAGAPVLIMDLRRPESVQELEKLVDTYAGDVPAVLRRDFRNSLFAAFRPQEVRAQLRDAGLSHLDVRIVSDRHLAVIGRLRGA